MHVSFSAAEIVAITQPRATRGATTDMIRGLSSLTDAVPGELTFLGNARYKADVATTRASVLLLPSDYTGDPKPGQLFLLLDNPSVALAQVCARIEQSLWPRPAPGVHPSAVISEGAQIASTATVGPHCVVESGAIVGERVHLQAQIFVGRNAAIGDDCWLMPGVVLAAECVLGSRVRVQPGAMIGADGFGYEFVKGRHEKIPQVGIVVVGDDVEIGANSTIDRARFSRTVVGEGTKIDNLVQIGHNVTIGRHCLLCSQVGISGSTKLEDYVVLAGQVGVGGHISIGKGTKAGGQAGITADVAAGSFINGTPAIPYLLERRIAVLQQRLPELFKRVDSLEAQIRDTKMSSS
jgi:UDP-3-O-[3-hydroxymyristoyl] glucosamine N-acyltransferase